VHTRDNHGDSIHKSNFRVTSERSHSFGRSLHDSEESEDFEEDLMSQLLNVVENQLVEENELEELHKELQVVRNENQSRLSEAQTALIFGISALKSNLTGELMQKEEHLNREYIELRDEILAEFRTKEQGLMSVFKLLQDAVQSNVDPSRFKMQNEAVHLELQHLKRFVAQKLELIKSKLAADTREMEQLVTSSISRCEETVQNKLLDLSSKANSEFAESRINIFKGDPHISPSPNSSEQE